MSLSTIQEATASRVETLPETFDHQFILMTMFGSSQRFETVTVSPMLVYGVTPSPGYNCHLGESKDIQCSHRVHHSSGYNYHLSESIQIVFIPHQVTTATWVSLQIFILVIVFITHQVTTAT